MTDKAIDLDVVADMREMFASAIMDSRPKGVNQVIANQIAVTITNKLEKRGKVLIDASEIPDKPDAHLIMMKKMRKRLEQELDDPETSARDIAALSLRMIAVSKEVTMLEERHRSEKSQRAGSGNGKTSGSAASATPRPINI